MKTTNHNATSVIQFAMRLLRGGVRRLSRDPNGFLKKLKGVIHVGANSGQERDQYAANDLNVAWIEPIPDVFVQLQANLKSCAKQQAFQYLVTDKDGHEYDFHIANNNGASSSILQLNLHKHIWPQVSYITVMKLQSVTLATFVKRHSLDMHNYDALVMDTQGSELLVLKGAQELLPHFRFIKTEVPDFDSYRECCHLKDVSAFLNRFGFKQFNKHRIASADGVGSYYDVVYKQVAR